MKRNLFKIFLAPLGLVVLSAALRAGDTAIVDGQNAEDVVGQTTSGSADFTGGTAYDSQYLEGYNMPYDVAVDTANHRLFVADTFSNRVLQYDLNASNVLVERTADHVLGQPTLYGNAPGTRDDRLYTPTGLDYDPGRNYLFITENANHRVLVFDVSSISDGENAINVLGQSNFTANSWATSVNKMYAPYFATYDGVSRLFVSDTGNHRILVFDVASITNGENAVNVLGQSDFTTGTSGLAANKLNSVREVCVDKLNGLLYASDSSNYRVLVFNVNSITDGENAVNVLGQTDFTTNSSTLNQAKFSNPYGLAYSSGTQRLFVADSSRARIMVFDVAAITDGENAINVLGQSTYTTNTQATTRDGMYNPLGMTLDDNGNKLYMADYRNFRVQVFNVSTTTITNGQNAEDVIGQIDGGGNAVYTTANIYNGLAVDGLNQPIEIEIDTTTHRMFVSDGSSNRVLIYNLDTSNTLADRVPDNVLGQPTMLLTRFLTTRPSLYIPFGLTFDPTSNRLFVADANNHRIIVYDVASITDGENAINVLGKNNYTSASYGTTQSSVNNPQGIVFERSTSRLFVAEYGNNRVTVFDVSAITDGENAVNVLGQNDFTTATSGTDQNKLYLPRSVAVNESGLLAVADYNNHRVMIFDVSSITDGENAINVLGQTTFTTRTAATTQSGMAYSRDVAFDTQGQRLFVSEETNNRVTVFDISSITNGENAINLYGQTVFTNSIAGTTQGKFNGPRGLTYDGAMNRLYIADYLNHRVMIQSAGPVSPSTSTLSATGGGDQIALSWNSAGDDGAFNNLTGTYRIQYATYTATWSTSTTPTNATTITISTTNATAGSAQSRVISGLTIGTTYYFALFTADEVPNWSEVSNTTSAVPTAWFDPNQIEVDSANGGLKNGGQGWGDFDNDGDLDIVAAGYTGSTRELRIYRNNGNGTIDAAQIEVDGAGNGLDDGDVIWGDYDNDGDLDIAVMGNTAGNNRQLRIYKNNGNGTMSATQIEVDGSDNGLSQGRLGWGDFDNDGDLDLVGNGRMGANATPYLRIYKNNGNGTINATQIEVDPTDGGLLGECAWGDYDNDGDLDILLGGAGATDIRVYTNNGNGTLNPTQVNVVTPSGGYPTVAWGDFDADGDLDVLSCGYNAGGGRNTNIYKNNGNGTFNGTPLYVDGFNGGLASGRSAWGDFDNDGDLDILTSGVSSDWTSRQLRVYKNNGNGTMNETQFEIEGVNNGLESSVATWGDFDNDGDLDILASGTDDGTNQQLRIYKNLATPSNTAPSAPTTLAGGFTFDASGVSVASLTWNTGIDAGTSPTTENVLTYDIQISTVSNFASVIFPGQMGATPRMGSYLKPPKIFNSNSYYGVVLKSTDPWNAQSTASYGLRTDTTYYYRVKTVDAGQAESGWSNGASINTAVSPSTNTLVAASTTNDYEITVTWNSAGDDGMSGNLTGNYRIQYATFTASWSTSTTPSDVTTVTISTTNAVPGSSQSRTFSSLTPGLTYYFVLWTADEVPNWSYISNTASALSTTWFDPNQIEVDGATGGGLKEGDVAWGDYDADGDLDVLLSGTVEWPTYQLRIYKNNGNGTIDPAQIEVDGLNNGLGNSEVQWGDFDVDGDLDILVAGRTGSTAELRIYKNNGNGTISATQIEVDGAGGGGYAGGSEWGDFDNDGDLDILISGYDTSSNRLRIYKNNGNGTMNQTEIDVDGATVSSSYKVRWGDFDGDGDLDFMTAEMNIYKNNGNGTMNPTEYLFGGVDSGLFGGGLAWGDFDNDGDLDVLANGTTSDQGRLRIYKNNGNGTLNSSEIVVDGAAGGLYSGDVAWGDYDNDGDLEILASGYASSAASSELRVYKNNGNATMDSTQQEVDGSNGGLNSSAVAAGDYDGDGDLDILVVGQAAGSKELRVYENLIVPANTTPAAPTTLAGGFTFDATSLSVASFTWNAGTDSGTGATPENVLTYDIQISTVSNFASVIFPGQMGATPRMGSYLKPPKIFNSNTYYGVVMKSTDPWNAQTTASYGLRTDTTYYYRVKTVDSVLAESGWSSNGSAYTGVAPSTSTLTATAGAGQVTIGWNSAGDDGMNGNVTGYYRIQYATYTPTWSTSTTPTNAATVSISTTNVVPGSAQSKTIGGLTSGLTYYFVLWTGDEVPNWSSISNTTSAYVASDFQWFDDVQIEVDGAGNGLKWGTVAWGDYDNDGDPDILVNGETGSTRELRIYKNNGNGTMDATQIEVDGAGNGLRYGTTSWGDFDNDGDLDIGVLGWVASTRQLRVYRNNGNGTMNATQVEVDGGDGGMADGGFMWGDYDNDGDIDILAAGVPSGGNSELRIYKNNGNATTDRTQIEVDGVNGGVQLCGVAWGDYDGDGDLDVLAMGATAAGGRELRIYKNNGNGTVDPAQIEVDGSGNGMQDGGVAWGDFDSDGDLDLLAVGYTGSTRELRIYKNNGNGTMDPAQIEVDGSGNGLRYSGVAWGDFDVDGDLDIVTSGQQTSGTSRELRVYKNNGNATMDATQIEVDGSGNGMQDGGVAWGDFDLDGDLDILASGEQTSGTTRELRIYKNQSTTANTAPTAPGTLTGSWDYSATGISTATFKWAAGGDTGTGSTAVNALTYAVEVSSVSGFTGKSVATGLWSSPGMGNYLKPPKIFDGNTTHGLMLRYLPQTNTTYYFRVKTVDAGLKESAWSATGSVYTLVASSAPSVVTDLAASASVTDGQMSLTWTAPTNVNSGANSAYDVRYSTVGPITNDTEFSNATALTGEPTPGSAGMSQTMTATGLVPLSTCYFAIKTSNDNGTSGLDVSNPRASAVAHAFDATQIDVDGSGGGPGDGSAVWGDFENDGDLDILVSGTVSGSRELRIYKNNANGTISSTQVEVDGGGNGLTYSRAIWGDYDNDGDLDILAMGYNGSTRELRIYKNNGNATMDAGQIEVDGSGNGLQEGSVAWGDFDNDGDLDILISGYNGSTRELRIYKNNGNGTIDAAQIEVDGSGGGLRYSGVAWGDYDNDGDLDLLATGQQTTGTTKELRIYKNNGNATMDPAQIEVDGSGNGMDGSVAWGDFDIDGDLDILLAGLTIGSTRELRIYKNNGNGTINATQIEVDGSGNGLNLGVVDWGDFDNDGDLDILTHGSNVGYSQLRVYQNNGNATIDAAQIEVDGLNGGLENGEAHWGDYDADGDLDVLICGSNNLRVYKNKHDLKQVNTTPAAPTTLAGGFTFDASGVSVASLTWNAGTDSGTGATPENVLTYDIQISTVSNFASVIFPGQMGATPRMGSYLKPPKIFNSNTYYGVVMKSTDPWNAQTTASYGLRTDTTYYYRIKAVDSALAESGWSSNGSAYTGVAPSTSTLAAASTATDGEVLLTWNSAGDDGMNGNLTGTYRIQYATYTPTWSTSSTPTNATTVTIATTTQVPGSAQAKLITGLTGGLTYYFVLWTGDEVPNWSTISNSTSAVPTLTVDVVSPSTSTLSAASANPEEVVLTWTSAGDDGSTGNLTGNYRIQNATYSATWDTGSTPTNATTVTIATTTQTPGSAQSKTITGLISGTTYYFAIYTQDEASNWSSVSNTTSAVGGFWFDPNQIEVDGAGWGLHNGGVSWGDYDNDGDLDVLASGGVSQTGTGQLRIYKNNGNATINPAQIEVDGVNGGLYGGVRWGDYDNDGDLDILTGGISSSGTKELRIYKNNGNGTIDPAQIEVDGAGGGTGGGGDWGDYDNDGDLDILVSGGTALKIYKNIGNGTMDSLEMDVDGAGGGLSSPDVGWGDFDNDGDLDMLLTGYTGAVVRQLRIYRNNGNGTINPTQIEVDGAGNGMTGRLAWGDYDSDGDLDILLTGNSSTNDRQLRIYKNNGNGTIDPAQIEVDGFGGGVEGGGAGWGDFDNDGDIDILINGMQSSGFTVELRVYKNNGNGTIDSNQIEVDGPGGGMSLADVAWGDFDMDSDIDVLALGTSGGYQLRIYKNLCATANNSPSAPTTLSGTWAHNPTGSSTATFKWNSGSDNGATPTQTNGLTYQLEISSNSGFAGKSLISSPWTTPGTGNYLKPPKIYDGNTNHGVYLRALPQTNTTYYFRVKSIDAGLKESAWSTTGSLYTAVASSAPSSVSDLVASVELGEGQLTLTWTAPLNIDAGAAAAYDIRYSSTGAITNDTEFNNATALTGEPTPGLAGTGESMVLRGIVPYQTMYFGMKSSNANGTSGLDVSNPRPSAVAKAFDASQIEVDGMGGGLVYGGTAWGDYDNDGDVDILVNGTGGGASQLRIYKNNGNGTIDTAQIEVDGVNNGLTSGGVAWGDYDHDGDLDILICGITGSSREFRIYKNNGNGSINPAQIEIDGTGNGLTGVAVWGDYDNDGDLDILAEGMQTASSSKELRVYKNNGNGSIEPGQIEVDGAGNGMDSGGAAWGDYDNDGDLDILVSGSLAAATAQLRIYKNNGNGTVDPNQIEVDGAGGGLRFSSLAWGDYDNDGDLDILVSGETGSSSQELRVYKNNGNGTIDVAQVEVDGSGGGLYYGGVSWGDLDNDGDLDILASGSFVSELRVYRNNGNGTINATQEELDATGKGLNNSSAIWGDFENDGDIDALGVGFDSVSNVQIRIYSNRHDVTRANTTPAAPTTLAGGFTFNSTGVSVASMTWNAGTDSGTGATPENVLTYDIQISTVSNFASVIFPGQMGATPRMGSYLKPPKIFNGNTYYGVVMKSTDPWNAQTTASYGLRTDTTYYYRVKTVDSALAESSWSNGGNAYTGVAPSTSTLAAASTATDGEVLLTWNSAGDDGMNGNVTGTYRIQYATYTPTWSTSSTPTNATTVTIATTTQVPGSAQSKLITGLTGGLTYYFVLWTGDEVPNWSTISNSTSAVPFVSIRSMTIEGLSTLGFGVVNLGSQVVASTGVVIRNDGTLMNRYSMSASTDTVGTPWSIQASTPAGPDGMVIYGLFDGDTGPVLGNFDVDDVIGPTDNSSSSSIYSIDGSTTGTNVPAGEDRKLWIRMDMPTTSRTETPQSIRIRITAEPP